MEAKRKVLKLLYFTNVLGTQDTKKIKAKYRM